MVIFNSYFDITRGYTTVHTETFFFSASPNYWWSQSSLTTGCGPIAPRSLFVKPWAWTPRSTQALQGRSGMGRWDTHFLRVLISISTYIYSIYYIHIYIYIHTYIYIYIYNIPMMPIMTLWLDFPVDAWTTPTIHLQIPLDFLGPVDSHWKKGAYPYGVLMGFNGI